MMTTREKVRILDTSARIAALMFLFIAAVSAVVTVACAPIRPPAVVTPDAAHLEAAGDDCAALWQDELGRPIDVLALADCRSAVAEGRRTIEDFRVQLRASGEYADYQARLEAERRPVARRGVVGLAGRTFVDADGPWLAVGTTCFWCGWGYLHERERLDANLAALAGRVDYVRALAVVGPRGGWEDRTVSAADVFGSDVIAGTTDAAYAHGLRVQWTIFGGLDSTPTPEARRQLVHRVVEQLASRREKVQLVEVANEGWQNGFDGEEGRQELIALGNLVRAALPGVPVALTAPNTVEVRDYYEGSSATVATVHTERNVTGTGGMFRPVRQAREYVGLTWINNEPIGPQSSVAADDDPDRLALAAAYTWLCNGAAYVYHTGAGIRGGGAADRARGRSANFAEVPHFDATLERLAALREILPPDLPNWTWQNSNSRFPAYLFATPYEDEGGTHIVAPEDELLRAFAAYAADGRFVVIPIAVTRPVPFTAKRSIAFAVHDVRNLRAATAVTLSAGETFTLQPTPGAVFVGRFR